MTVKLNYSARTHTHRNCTVSKRQLVEMGRKWLLHKKYKSHEFDPSIIK